MIIALWLTSPSGCKHLGLPGGGMTWWMAGKRRPQPVAETLFGSAETQPYQSELHLHMGRNKRERRMTNVLQQNYFRETVHDGLFKIYFFLIWFKISFFRNNKASPGPELPIWKCNLYLTHWKKQLKPNHSIFYLILPLSRINPFYFCVLLLTQPRHHGAVQK